MTSLSDMMPDPKKNPDPKTFKQRDCRPLTPTEEPTFEVSDDPGPPHTIAKYTSGAESFISVPQEVVEEVQEDKSLEPNKMIATQGDKVEKTIRVYLELNDERPPLEIRIKTELEFSRQLKGEEEPTDLKVEPKKLDPMAGTRFATGGPTPADAFTFIPGMAPLGLQPDSFRASKPKPRLHPQAKVEMVDRDGGSFKFPRRSCVDQYTESEHLIRDAVYEIEGLGAHPWLTDAITLLDRAKEAVADWLELPTTDPLKKVPSRVVVFGPPGSKTTTVKKELTSHPFGVRPAEENPLLPAEENHSKPIVHQTPVGEKTWQTPQAQDRTRLGVYLASAFERKPELQGYNDYLPACCKRMSTWLHPSIKDPPMSDTTVNPKVRLEAAQRDLHDMEASDVLVCFTSPDTYSTGGHHIELGYMLAQGKKVILVGRPLNVFHYLPGIIWAKDWDEARAYLTLFHREMRLGPPKPPFKGADLRAWLGRQSLKRDELGEAVRKAWVDFWAGLNKPISELDSVPAATITQGTAFIYKGDWHIAVERTAHELVAWTYRRSAHSDPIHFRKGPIWIPANDQVTPAKDASQLTPWDRMPEGRKKEVDRRIGEKLVEHLMEVSCQELP